MLNECLQKFKESVSVGVIWSREKNQIQARYENSSDEYTFYLIQGELIFFNKCKRAVGGVPLTYKYLKPGQVLFDNFKDLNFSIPETAETAIIRVYSVECDNPFNCTSFEEKTIEIEDHDGNPKLETKRIFDTDLFQLPEND